MTEVAFRLYVAGATPASRRAVRNVTRRCREELAGEYTLQIVDLYQRPDLARGGEVAVAPTLVRLAPEPVTRIVGDLSDPNLVLVD